MMTVHPKRTKCCALCKSWDGDANLTLVNQDVGFRADNSKRGKCAKSNNNSKFGNESCSKYEPSVEASRIL